jgi:hypothetical protein
MKNQQGDLVYLPASIMLIKREEAGAKTVTQWVNIEEPSVVLVTRPNTGDPDDPYVGVHYEGSNWLARAVDCLEVLTSHE